MNDELMTRITEAVDQYRDARRSAFLSLRRDWGRISPAQVDKARLEEIFANCEYFSVSLLELSEQLRELVLCMSELQAELDLRSTKNAWSWLQRACQPLCRRNLTQVAQTGQSTRLPSTLGVHSKAGIGRLSDRRHTFTRGLAAFVTFTSIDVLFAESNAYFDTAPGTS